MLAVFFIALMQVLELMEMTTDVLERGLGAAGLAYYAALRAPSQVVVALPLAALLGAMWAFHDLARNHEMIAIRTAGINLKQIVAYLLPVPMVVAAAYVALSQGVVPEADATLQSWWIATAPPDDTPEASWLRTSAGPVSYRAASPDGQRLTDVRIYVRGENTLLSERISAQSAHWQQGVWQLEGVERLVVPGEPASRSGEPPRTWKTNLGPDDVRRADIVRPKLSSTMLLDVIGGERVASQPLSYYQTALFRSLVAPLAPFIMLLLALPAARGLPRRNDGGGALLLALGLGLGFLLCDGFMGALGTAGRAPAAVAALAAPLLFSAIGLLQLHFSERR
jgi:lipopolysaccharide export system permease protein